MAGAAYDCADVAVLDGRRLVGIVPIETLIAADPGASIVELIDADPIVVGSALAEVATVDGGLLLVGSRGYGALRRVLLGSVSAALVRSAPLPAGRPRPAKEEWRGAPDTYPVARGRL